MPRKGSNIMQKSPQRIEIVRTNIKALSSMSIKSAEAIAKTLQMYFDTVTIATIDTPKDLDALLARKPDLAFLGMHYVIDTAKFDAKIWLSDVLEQHGIAHTGSSKFAHRLGINKHLAKQRMIESGIQTSAYQIIAFGNNEVITEGTLTFPLFVKPTNKGGGQGIDEFSVVRTTEELRSKVQSIHENHHTDVLVEEYLGGREFSVAIIEDRKTHGLVAMPLELVARQNKNGERILGSALKSTNTTTILAVSDPVEHEKITSFAINAFTALGAHDYGRIDIRCDEFGVPHFLEANLIPSLIEGYGSFPKAYDLNIGLSYETMLLHVVGLALDKLPQKLHASEEV